MTKDTHSDEDAKGDSLLLKQSEDMVAAFSALMRNMFALASDDLSMELPGAQLRVCGMLWDGPKTMSVLTEEIGITHSAITQIADRLEKAEMVERVPEADDRRCKKLALTAKGIAVMEDRRRRRVLRVMNILRMLSLEERDEVVGALRTVANASLRFK